MEVIETSNYYQLLQHKSSRKLLVVCSSLDTRAPKFTFWKLAQKLNCNCLFLNSPMTHWYRNGVVGIPNGVYGVRDKIWDVQKKLLIEETIFFGVSMGGYGAILFGSLSNADHIISFSVEPLLGVPGGRTEVTRNKFQPLYPDLRSLKIPKLTLIYGEMDIADTIGASLLNEYCDNIIVYKLPYAEHDVANSLNYRGELLPLLEKLIYGGEVTNTSIVRTSISPGVFNLIYHINNDYRARRWELVKTTLENHTSVVRESLLLKFIYATCQYKTGSFSSAKYLLVDILKIERQCPHVWGLISSCDIKLGLYEMAVKSADTAIRLKPAYSLFHMTKCMALEGLGLYSEAYEEVKISCMLNPRHKMYFEVLNKLARLSSRETVELAPLIQQKKDTAFLNKINALFDNSQALNFDLSLFN